MLLRTFQGENSGSFVSLTSSNNKLLGTSASRLKSVPFDTTSVEVCRRKAEQSTSHMRGETDGGFGHLVSVPTQTNPFTEQNCKAKDPNEAEKELFPEFVRYPESLRHFPNRSCF